MEIKKILSIAGSDSSGGAGIQADLKTITSYKFYGMTAITAITAQNTMGVQASSPISEQMLKSQLLSICQDIMLDAVKIGMVASPGQVEVISEIAEKYFKDLPIVLDPVITSTSGFTLVPDDTLEKMKEILFQKATLITPNLIEAGIIYGKKIESLEEMKEAAEFLYNKYKVAFLIKGGHLKDSKDDVLCGREGLFVIEGKNIDNKNTHGTGCTLSSALACELAKGKSLYDALVAAKKYLSGAIAYGFDIGRGRGPLYHMYNLSDKNEN
ncbi:bifunctional hydroxymethylpyrimidine kinase/phosphomethylpyrimidine kinase [Peptoniphilus hominis (ex Hitch et al. 2025)]|uniref:Hydroxymethylpyrimidine/phosphomethylpyrimidine kinase n=1 Tax=Peptoniphilus hominis (ex Hitch et al. 2025) TaxID=3133174 RepID=A0ABV1CCZ9_9FIRM